MLNRRRWLLFALGALGGACAHTPVLRVQPARARIRLLPVDVRDPDPELRAEVEQVLPDALVMHGFYLIDDGAPVRVEVSIGPFEIPRDGLDMMGSRPATSYLDFTALLASRPRPLVARATGVGESMAAAGVTAGSVGSEMGVMREARRAAVRDGTLRLARAMVDLLGSAPWS